MGGKFIRKKYSKEKGATQSRKQLRKEKRLEKKVKKSQYFQNRHKKNKIEKNKIIKVINDTNIAKNDKLKKLKAFKSLGHVKHDSSDDDLEVKSPKVIDVLSEQKKEREKEIKLKLKLQREMSAQRKKQLIQANIEEDRVIKKLGKQLKLNKRKNKSVPKSFVDEGLDYLLEVCDSERIQGVSKTEMNLQESGSEFEDDFAIVTGRKKIKTKVSHKHMPGSESDYEDSEIEEQDYSENDDGNFEVEDHKLEAINKKLSLKKNSYDNKNENFKSNSIGKNKTKQIENNKYDSDELVEDMDTSSSDENAISDDENSTGDDEAVYDEDNISNDGDFSSDDDSDETNEAVTTGNHSKDNNIDDKNKCVGKKVSFSKKAVTYSLDKRESSSSVNDLESENEDSVSNVKEEGTFLLKSKNRKRNASINFKQEDTNNKMIKRKKEDNDYSGTDDDDDDDDNADDDDNDDNADVDDVEEERNTDELWEDIYGRTRDKKGNVVQTATDKYVPPHLRAKNTFSDVKRAEELSRLRKQLKGLINRLAENNMHNISSQIDNLYMKNSRNDMNETLTYLIFESIIGPTLTSERLVMEHIMLMTILHANVGMEVGAHFLQSVVKKFDEMYNAGQDVEDKSVDNVLLIMSHLYNFKVFNSVLMYNLLDKLSEKFSEKEVELILLILRNVGFSLRKDDPLALKDLILRLQKKANESGELRSNTRVRFMLDILLAVKNNNMTKIPQYDPSYSEHLKKLIKTMIHKGKYITELKITLDDLLKVEEQGRWWIVGSAWTGNKNSTSNIQNSSTIVKTDEYSSTILELARKQRMNTDTRRNIFCILMSAEDFMDAFEKLLRLGLKAGQEQEIIHVLIHCLLQEKNFNPYYAHLASQLCLTDRKHQLTIQYNVWDRLKELSDLTSSQITNLAKFLAHLFLEKSLPISVLKVVQFSDMDKACVKLMRQILLSTLLHNCEETMTEVFTRVSKPAKLHMFRESLRLFLHHFVLRNVKNESDETVKLRERVKLAETALTSVDTSKLIF